MVSTKRVSRNRKDSASGVSTDDPTDTSEGTESYFLQPTRHDLLPLVLAIVSIILGLTAALTSYFLLVKAEQDTARSQLQVALGNVQKQLDSASASLGAVITSTAALFEVSKTPITLYDQFAPYVYSGGSFPKFMTGIHYVEYSDISLVDNFTAQIRARGGEYANFTIWGTGANGMKEIPPPYAPTRCVVTQTVPTANMPAVLGYDACTEPIRQAALAEAYYTKKLAGSGAITSILSTSTVSVLMTKFVYSNITQGTIAATIVLTDFFNATVSGIIDNFEVSLYDLNATTADPYLYTTWGGIETATSSKDNSKWIASAPYTYNTTFTFASRTYRIQIAPYDGWGAKFQTSSKYVGLIVSLVIMLILLIICAFIYFVRKLLIAKQRRAETSVQIDLLKTNQTALRTLLDRIAVQESKTRAVINSLMDCICVISPTGKILQTNSAFDETFPFTQQEMEKGVYSWDVFTELASDFFRVCNDQEIQTQATRRFGDMIDVSIRVRDLRGKDGESSTSQSNEKSGNNTGNTGNTGKTGEITNVNIQLADLEEAYVIIAKNISAKLSQLETNRQERARIHDFARKFRDHRFRDELREYCEQNKNVENILFLERIREYKKASFGERVDMKTQIYDKFIKDDAPMQLNLSNETVVEESIKINKSMGDVDVFKNIEEIVLRTLTNDIYPRFQAFERERSGSNPTTPTSPTTPMQLLQHHETRLV